MTDCYAMVRGSAIRVTGLGSRGQVPDSISYAVSKAVSKVTINEVVEQPGNESLRNPEEERRLRFVKNSTLIRYKVDIEFLRVDPGVLSLVSGVPLVYGPGSSGGGFGEMPFGEGAFGAGSTASGDVVGFDSTSRVKPVSFALEVWSKLAGQRCVDGQQEWGYSVFPYLRGGHLSGFAFDNGLVSFNLVGAQTRKGPRWGVGPYDLDGDYQRLAPSVSRNTAFRQFITTAAPPEQENGVRTFEDVISNGTPANPMPDPTAVPFVNGGTPADAGPYIIAGGRP